MKRGREGAETRETKRLTLEEKMEGEMEETGEEWGWEKKTNRLVKIERERMLKQQKRRGKKTISSGSIEPQN